jgi:murein DD-endopeptidase MepM/ murein hydrolase activator NlpD
MVGFSLPSPVETTQQMAANKAASLQKQLTLSQHPSQNDQQVLHERLADFASIFIFQMLQSMRRTIPKSKLLDSGFANDLYHSLLDQEVANLVARRESMGLTELLQQQFKVPDNIGRESTPIKQAIASYRQQLPQGFPASFSMPVDGSVSSHYGLRIDPFEHDTQWHDGIDIAAPAGTLVRAVAPGRVLFSGMREGYGNLLILEHSDGYQTYYAHNATNIVDVGTEVTAGQAIAQVGQSGRATGPHLHFEIRKDGATLDPTSFLTSTNPRVAHK